VKIRPVADADVPALVALMNEATPAYPVDEAELRRWLTSPTGETEFALLADDAGEPIGYVDVYGAESAPDRAWLDARIPARAASDKTIAALVDWGESNALARGRSLFRAGVTPGEPLEAVLRARGYRPIRYSFRMRIDLESAPPAPAWPDGIDVQTFASGEERAVFGALEDAFADHWEFTPDPFEDFMHSLVGAEDFDPSLWFVARGADEIAGVALCRPSAPGQPGVGWVGDLGVRRAWRRRGLGLALLLHAFGSFWERGTKTVALGVDGENTTGAVRLYERAGMHAEHRLDHYEKVLASGVGSTEPPNSAGAGFAGAGADQ